MSRERRALLGARIPTTTASSRSNWGVDAKACHLKDLVHYLQINLGEGWGLYSFLSILGQIKHHQYILICSFVLLKSGYLGATDAFQAFRDISPQGFELGGTGKIGNFAVSTWTFGPKPADS